MDRVASTSLNSEPRSPPPTSHRVLTLYYPHLSSLSELFRGQPILKEKDPERFKQFLQECWVGTTDQAHGFPPLRVLQVEDRSISMSEILNQVLQRIFNAHSVQCQRDKKAGKYAWPYPKHVLACGHKLVKTGNETNHNHGGGIKVGAGAAYENVFTNTIASSLTSSKDWSTLLARIGPDSMIKILSSPSIGLFQPLQNGCFMQVSGIPVVELKILETPAVVARGSAAAAAASSHGKGKGGRKTHVRAIKKRGRKRKRGDDDDKECGSPDEGGGEGAVGTEDPMEIDSPSNIDKVLPMITVDQPAAQIDDSILRKQSRSLGPSKSAPSLLVNLETLGQPTQVSQTTQVRTQSQVPIPSIYPTLGPITQVGKGKAVVPGGKKLKEKKPLHSHNSIVFSRHRIYHARMSKTKDRKTIYGLSPKHILSRLHEPDKWELPTSAYLSSRPQDPQKTSKLYTPARHLVKYVFPRQFGLENVFEGEKINLWTQVRPDFEDREINIKKLGTIKTPARLKPIVVPLLNRMIVLHGRCNYRKLLGLKCPSKVSHRSLDEAEKMSRVTDLMSEPPATQHSRTNLSTTLREPPVLLPPGSAQPPNPSAASSVRIPDSQLDNRDRDRDADSPTMRDGEEGEGRFESSLKPIRTQANGQNKPKLAQYACTPYEVESYVQAVVRDVIPRAFWGSDRNAKLISKQISQFLRMRRFESISLHSLLQGFSILDCDWLSPTSSLVVRTDTGKKKKRRHNDENVTPSDMEKRKELVAEFLYWVFDSFITDLVRTAFYVTDSATHQNRPLYFRQDDWNALTAPLLESLGDTVFKRVPDNEYVELVRQPRELSYSYVRLLPKEAGVRPIVNLARVPMQIGTKGEKKVGTPINKILRGVFDVLNFESKRKPHLVGSLVMNPQEIYAKLKQYRSKLLESSENGQIPELYFVKVDVKACFDTIKQDKLLALVEDILTETLYYIQKYSQVIAYSGKTARQFKRQACADDDLGSFKELAMKLAEELHDVVLSDQVRYEDQDRDRLMALLREHIKTNLVKVNGRLYRQQDGIPQGSILSSLLCSLFYGDMENTHLAFTKDLHSLLMRYVDDFMFVTTKKHLAVRFLQTMHRGIPDYGCFISTEKRLTNFDVSLDDGEVVPPLPDGADFGYCGLAIDTKTLEIKMNLQLQMNKEIVNQLTVQRYRKPGEAFLNAMLRAVKVRAHSMYTDTNFNSSTTVYANIYQAMLVVALKYRAYVQEWCGSLKGKVVFFWNAVQKIVKYEYSALVRQGSSRKAAKLSAAFNLERLHVVWLGYHAFHRVLSRYPATFAPLLRLLLTEIKTPRVRKDLPLLRRIVNDDKNKFIERSG